jgi:hypothetical protein
MTKLKKVHEKMNDIVCGNIEKIGGVQQELK